MKTMVVELPSCNTHPASLDPWAGYLLVFLLDWFFCGVVLGHVCPLFLVNPRVPLSFVVTEHGPIRVLLSGMQQAVGINPPVILEKNHGYGCITSYTQKPTAYDASQVHQQSGMSTTSQNITGLA
jgi:hypothetical protein